MEVCFAEPFFCFGEDVGLDDLPPDLSFFALPMMKVGADEVVVIILSSSIISSNSE